MVDVTSTAAAQTVRRWAIGPRTGLIPALLVLGVLIQAGLFTARLRAVPREVELAHASEAEVQRRLNGPIVAYARELRDTLGEDSCVQLLQPDVAAGRQTGRMWTFFNVYPLSHNLYPRSVRLVADADEAIAAPECGTASRFALVWLENDVPETDPQKTRLRLDLAALQSGVPAGAVSQVSHYEDAQGNVGYLFAIGG